MLSNRIFIRKPDQIPRAQKDHKPPEENEIYVSIVSKLVEEANDDPACKRVGDSNVTF